MIPQSSVTNEPLRNVHSAARRAARHLKRTHGAFRNIDPEDIVQDLLRAAIPALEHFDVRRGSRGAHLDRVLHNRSISLIRREQAARRDWRRNGPSLSQVSQSGADAAPLCDLDESAVRRHSGSRFRTDIERSDIRADIGHIVQTMPPQHRRYAGLLMEGHSHEQARRKLGKSRRVGDQMRRELKRVFEQDGLQEYL